MPNINLKFSGDIEAYRVTLGQRKVSFANDGTASVDVAVGSVALMWAVEGAVGTKYLLEVVAPKAAQFQHGATLDTSEQDAGLQWLAV